MPEADEQGCKEARVRECGQVLACWTRGAGRTKGTKGQSQATEAGKGH